MTILDLTTYSDEQLVQLKEKIGIELEARTAARRESVLKEIREKAMEAGITGAELAKLLGKGSGTGRKAPIKYRDPNDASNTWTGRGRKPKWVEAHLQQGMTLEQLSV